MTYRTWFLRQYLPAVLAGLLLVLTPAVASASYITTVTTDAPQFWWHVNESSGNAADNGVKTGGYPTANGTVNASVNQGVATLINDTPPSGGTAYDFDTTGNGVVMPDTQGINDQLGGGNTGRQEYSVELWFEPDVVSGRQVLWMQGGATRGFLIYLQGTQLYVGGHNQGNDSTTPNWGEWVSTAAGAVAADTIYHAVLRFDGDPDNNPSTNDGVIEGYLNGSIFAMSTDPVGRIYDHAQSSFGYSRANIDYHNGQSDATNRFDGVIDEVAVYDGTALAAGRISAHYAAGIPEPATLAVVVLGFLGVGVRRRRVR